MSSVASTPFRNVPVGCAGTLCLKRVFLFGCFYGAVVAGVIQRADAVGVLRAATRKALQQRSVVQWTEFNLDFDGDVVISLT
jgi:hypothetical protein